MDNVAACFALGVFILICLLAMDLLAYIWEQETFTQWFLNKLKALCKSIRNIRCFKKKKTIIKMVSMQFMVGNGVIEIRFEDGKRVFKYFEGKMRQIVKLRNGVEFEHVDFEVTSARTQIEEYIQALRKDQNWPVIDDDYEAHFGTITGALILEENPEFQRTLTAKTFEEIYED